VRSRQEPASLLIPASIFWFATNVLIIGCLTVKLRPNKPTVHLRNHHPVCETPRCDNTAWITAVSAAFSNSQVPAAETPPPSV
jgi:hypothetical protein